MRAAQLQRNSLWTGWSAKKDFHFSHSSGFLLAVAQERRVLHWTYNRPANFQADEALCQPLYCSLLFCSPARNLQNIIVAQRWWTFALASRLCTHWSHCAFFQRRYFCTHLSLAWLSLKLKMFCRCVWAMASEPHQVTERLSARLDLFAWIMRIYATGEWIFSVLKPLSDSGIQLERAARWTMDLKVETEEMESNQPPPIEVFAHSSTLHGISHIFTYERFCVKRCLWLVFFLGSLTFLLYVCVDRIHFYLEYPHVTKLDEVTTPIMTFPAVTFCNLNAFRFSRVTRNDLYHAGELLALLNQR